MSMLPSQAPSMRANAGGNLKAFARMDGDVFLDLQLVGLLLRRRQGGVGLVERDVLGVRRLARLRRRAGAVLWLVLRRDGMRCRREEHGYGEPDRDDPAPNDCRPAHASEHG